MNDIVGFFVIIGGLFLCGVICLVIIAKVAGAA